MNRFLSFLLLLLLLTLLIVGCGDGKIDLTPIEKPTATSKRIKSINHTSDVIAKVEESSTVAESSDTEKPTENIGHTIIAADDLVKTAMESKPTAKVVSKSIKKISKPEVKPVKKPKPNPAKSPPTKYLPKIEFDEVTYDFGEITEGDIIEHSFLFTNSGKTNLSIEKATATCGCTKPSFPFIDIKPGETGYIGVTYNSVNKEGGQMPQITVFSNAIRREITLSLSGIVKPKLQDEKEVVVDTTESMPQDTTKY